MRFLPYAEAYPYKDENFILNILHKIFQQDTTKLAQTI